jgi:hypothetical protein
MPSVADGIYILAERSIEADERGRRRRSSPPVFVVAFVWVATGFVLLVDRAPAAAVGVVRLVGVVDLVVVLAVVVATAGQCGQRSDRGQAGEFHRVSALEGQL